MSYESTAEPIKLGFIMDFTLPPGFPEELKDDFFRPFEVVFADGHERGLIDRPVKILYREMEGLPKGSVKAVIDAYAELVDEGCLAVFGPNITDNAVPVKEAIERRFEVPAISVSGSDDWLGEWTFALPQGSLTDEPIFWADLIEQGGHRTVGMVVEQSLVGQTYLKNFQRAIQGRDIRIVAEEPVAQTAQDVSASIRNIKDAGAEAIVHCGFGFGIIFVNPALKELDWDPPRFTGTAWQNAWVNPILWQAFVGWVGVDQYDEDNPVGQRFLDRYAKSKGSRPEWVLPLTNHDIANALLHAFADAHPLSPRGVKEALERVKSIPAAAGAPGTRVSFGKWTRRGWMGSGYLVARELLEDGVTHRRVARFGEVT